MNDNHEGHTIRASVGLFPGVLTVLAILLALTGNCGVCGFDRDYLGELLDARGSD